MRRRRRPTTGGSPDLRTLTRVLPDLWPRGQPALRARVVIALMLLVLAKLAVLVTPFAYRAAVDALAPEEQKVLVLRYGLEDRQSLTLEEVGQELDLTPARVDEIEVRALRKLRQPTRNR